MLLPLSALHRPSLLFVVVCLAASAAAQDCADYADGIRLRGRVDISGQIANMVVADGYAFLVERGDGIAIIDLADPDNPTTVATVTTPGFALDVAVQGEYAYVLAVERQLTILSIADPANPSIVSTTDWPGTSGCVDVSGDYAFMVGRIGDDYQGYDDYLYVVDVSLPAAPAVVDSVYVGDGDIISVADVHVSGSDVFVLGYMSLRAYYIGDPLSPILRTYITLDVECNSIDTVGSFDAGDVFAYVTSSERGLLIVDLTDPSAPTYSHGTATAGGADVACCGDRIYMARGSSYPGGGLHVLDASAPATPLIIGSLSTWHGVRFVEAAGDRVYFIRNVFEATAGKQLVVADTADPNFTPSVEKSIWTGSVAASDGVYTYLAGANLSILDSSDPYVPSLIASMEFPAPASARSIVLTDQFAYVSTSDNGLQIVDISTPASAARVNTVYTSTAIADLKTDGTYLYAAARSAGLYVFDITTPGVPTLVATLDTPGYCWSLAIAGDKVWMADDTGGLQVADISTPSSPYLATSITSFKAKDIVCEDGFAYITTPDDPIVVEFDHDSLPIASWTLPVFGEPCSLVCNDGFLYAARGGSEMYYNVDVFCIDDPHDPVYESVLKLVES